MEFCEMTQVKGKDDLHKILKMTKPPYISMYTMFRQLDDNHQLK